MQNEENICPLEELQTFKGNDLVMSHYQTCQKGLT